MTASLLDRVPLDQITEQARQVKFGRAVKRLLITTLFLIGWVAAKTLGVVWLGLAFCWCAVDRGWREAQGNRPTRSELREENERLRQAVARLGG